MDIHLYGVSSGATAALNISSNEDLPNLKSVLIEGTAPIGIGLPDRLLKPVFLFLALKITMVERPTTSMFGREFFLVPGMSQY